jgi:thiamine pyrophosphokinase
MRALIMCNGEMPPEGVLEKSLAGCALVIAADGGANTLLRMGVVPDVVTGDMDSFRMAGDEGGRAINSATDHGRNRFKSISETGFEIIHDPDQETNDLEKALKLALNRGATEAVILGATGFRLDHTLKNLSVLLQFTSGFNEILMRDASTDIRVIPKEFTMGTIPGQLISLFPLSGLVSGIITEGLRYPLNDETLENGVRDGTSNEATGKRVSIRYREGNLVLIAPHGIGS